MEGDKETEETYSVCEEVSGLESVEGLDVEAPKVK